MGSSPGPNDNPEQPLGEGGERLFEWFFDGDIEFTMPSGTMTLKLSEASAEALADIFRSTGAIVSGRRMFDVANGWGGRHPIDVPVFVVTHTVPQEWVKEGSPFTFVTDGLESAVKQAKHAAGDKIVGVGGANVARQCIQLGLLDEIYVQLVPVLLGGGVRLFDRLERRAARTRTCEGNRRPRCNAPDVQGRQERLLRNRRSTGRSPTMAGRGD